MPTDPRLFSPSSTSNSTSWGNSSTSNLTFWGNSSIAQSNSSNEMPANAWKLFVIIGGAALLTCVVVLMCYYYRAVAKTDVEAAVPLEGGPEDQQGELHSINSPLPQHQSP